MIVPRKTMQQNLGRQEKDLAEDIANLNKKVYPFPAATHRSTHFFD
jgi:hypothetical protein